MPTPSVEEFEAAARRGKIAPVRRRIPADLETPVSAFLKIRAQRAAAAAGSGATGSATAAQASMFLLESVERGIQVGRYSFIGVSSAATITLAGGAVTVTRGDDVTTHDVGAGDPLALVRNEIARIPALDDYDLPGPFAGAVGYLGYDVARLFERLPAPPNDGLGLPDFHFLIPRTLVVFDHVRSELEVVVLPEDGEPRAAYDAAVAEIDGILAALGGPLPVTNGAAHTTRHAVPESNMSRERFEATVREAKEHILAGDAFQIVLSQRLAAPTSTEPFQIYRALRILNPSPYMFFFDFGGFQMVGSSPELLAKLEKRRATVAPIAGTRPRGETTAHDLELENELMSDEKERAEHVMLVDLGRNDLGRVCETGSVQVDSLMHVEKYSHVMHIVSTVTGRLRDGLDAFDLLRASFPAGTVSGAPKIRAMEIIAGLERDKRGPYAGAVGYFGHDGDMDMCITIRTIVVQDGRYYVQAGAGIVADSDPAREYEETLEKARALVRAVTIAEEGL